MSYISEEAQNLLEKIGCRYSWTWGVMIKDKFRFQRSSVELGRILKTFSWINKLFVLRSTLEEEEMWAMAEFLPETKITKLTLSRSGINEKGASLLASTLAKTQIKYLDLSRNRILDEGASSLAAVLQGSMIEHLNISENGITDTGIQQVAPFLHGTQVKSLNLSCNMIENQGAFHLVSVIKETKLVDLDLSFNMISDEGALALHKASKECDLAFLGVGGCNLKQQVSNTIQDYVVEQMNEFFQGRRTFSMNQLSYLANKERKVLQQLCDSFGSKLIILEKQFYFAQSHFEILFCILEKVVTRDPSTLIIHYCNNEFLFCQSDPKEKKDEFHLY